MPEGRMGAIPSLFHMRKTITTKCLAFLCTTVAFLMAGAPSLRAQGSGESGRGSVSAGGFFSPSAVGFSASMPSRDGDLLHEIRILADLDGVLTGSEDIPGIKGTYLLPYVVKRAVSRKGYAFRVVAGPGISGGYLRDRGKGYGAVFCVCGTFGMDFILRSGVTLSWGMTTELGAHLDYKNRYNSTLTLYRNGLLNTVYPSVSIKYRFR